jgi:hypothetical protein
VEVVCKRKRVSRYLSGETSHNETSGPEPTPIRRSIGHDQEGFFKRGLRGQTDAAKHELEARIRTQAIKQQVRLEAQGKV